MRGDLHDVGGGTGIDSGLASGTQSGPPTQFAINHRRPKRRPDRYDDPTWNDVIISDEPAIQQGHVVLSEKPGLGVELNDEYLQSQFDGGEPLWQ